MSIITQAGLSDKSPTYAAPTLIGVSGDFESEVFFAPGRVIMKMYGAMNGGIVQIEEFINNQWVTVDAHQTTSADAFVVNLTVNQKCRIVGVGVVGTLDIYVTPSWGRL